MSLVPHPTIGIGELLETKRSRVPAFQRAFSWKNEEIDELFDDYASAMNRPEEYFVGMVVLMQEDRDDRLMIVDGQQRLATTCMIYAAMRDYFELQEPKDEDSIRASEQRLFQPARIGQAREPRLLLGADQRDFFISHVLAGKDDPRKARGSIGRVTPLPHRKIAAAFERVKTRVEKIAGGDRTHAKNMLASWDSFIATRAVVLPIYVTDERTAFQLFETMNERGRDLTIADLLKNHVYRQVPDKGRLEEVKRLWDDSMTRVTTATRESAATKFIHHYWTSKHGLTRERELYDKIRVTITTQEEAVAFVCILERNSKHYATILQSKGEHWSDLRDLKLDQCKPLLLACLDVLDETEEREVQKVLRLVFNWSVRFRVAKRFGSTDLENFYAKAGPLVRQTKIKSARKLAELLSDEVPTDAQFEKDFADFDEEAPQFARILLHEINRHHDKGKYRERPASRKTDDVSLEHILPSGAKISEWRHFKKETMKLHLNRLGNLTLLHGPTNRNLQAVPFAKKVSAYSQSLLPITNQIPARFQDWSPTTIKQRQDEFAALAPRLWPRTVS
jgi:hypothetical protein